MKSSIVSCHLDANGVSFNVLEQGKGPLVLCLHGFPDCAWSFAPMMGALAAAGYRAVAPFMRGYAPSAVPADGRYQTQILGEDVLALIDALGAERAIVIGHDWGAAAAYAAAVTAPARISKLVTMAVPYGLGLFTRMVADPVQQRRSWYMYLLASPLGEPALTWDDFAFFDRLWADWSPGFTPHPTHIARVKESLRAPGAALAAASYYKHLFLPELQDPALAAAQAKFGTAPLEMPALYLHGADDGCIGADIETEHALYTAGVEAEIIPRTGHFLHLEAPAIINARILKFLHP